MSSSLAGPSRSAPSGELASSVFAERARAEGVLPIALGEATKLAGRLLDSDKAYEFTVTFGVQTDTLDVEGTVVATSDHVPHEGAVDGVLAGFTGPIDQVPPAFSALKVQYSPQAPAL